MEYLQKNINSAEGMKSDNQIEGNFEQSLTDKMKNSNVLSTRHQKEAQRTEKNCNWFIIADDFIFLNSRINLYNI